MSDRTIKGPDENRETVGKGMTRNREAGNWTNKQKPDEIRAKGEVLGKHKHDHENDHDEHEHDHEHDDDDDEGDADS